MQVNSYTVYGLADPDDGTIHYVGRTPDPRARYNGHLKNGSKLMRLWLAALWPKRPALIVLDADLSDVGSRRLERVRISELLGAGVWLLNINDRPNSSELRTEAIMAGKERRLVDLRLWGIPEGVLVAVDPYKPRRAQ